jgi:hypothetical protein
MKPLFFLFILLMIGIACSTQKTETMQVDTTAVENTTNTEPPEEDGDMSGGSIAYQLQKNELATILNEFNTLKEASQKIVFEASYDLGGFINICHFQDGKLKFFHKYESGEGGFEETTLMKTETGNESVVRTGSETQGFFKWVDNGNTEWFTAQVNSETNTPEILESSEPVNYEAESLLKDILAKIAENKSKFTLVDGRYEWYIRKEKVESEYGGPTDVYEVIRIDPKLFDLDFKNVFPASN